MKEIQDVKKYFYVDESGDPTVLGRGGRDLLAEGTVSRTFMVGYVETQDPKTITKSLSGLRKELAEDEYLAEVPSMASTLRAFHANKDCAEVKERVFKLLRQMDFTTFAVVARKSEALFRKKFDFSNPKLYEYLVSKLFENRLHLYKRIDIYFAEMGNTVRERNMQSALEEAMQSFRRKWDRENESEIRVFIQSPSQIPMLQVADYALWTINRAYERGDFRYYRFLSERIALVQDIFDTKNYPNTYYSPKRPLDPEKISPAGG
jgi:hypothetical protein